jgi:hypothetical protein
LSSFFTIPRKAFEGKWLCCKFMVGNSLDMILVCTLSSTPSIDLPIAEKPLQTLLIWAFTAQSFALLHFWTWLSPTHFPSIFYVLGSKHLL